MSKIAILGAAESGVGAAVLALKKGYDVFVSDMGKIKELWNYIRQHKYAVTIGLFLLIICVTDENNVIKRLQHQRQIRELKREIAVYEEIRDESVKGLQELANDSNNLEDIARERYGMHLPNEEVFIIK